MGEFEESLGPTPTLKHSGIFEKGRVPVIHDTKELITEKS